MFPLLEKLRSGELTLQQLKEKYGIEVREYDDRYVLNYNQIDSHPYRFDPIVRVCRQLILAKDFSHVMHRSFDRFFNINEDPHTAEFDMSKAICEEKLDGSLIGLYWDGKQWCHCSKSMAYAEGNLSDNTKYKSFGDLIDDNIDLSSIYNNGNKKYSYLFELMSEFDPHVTVFKGTAMYLLAIRNKETGEYIDKYSEGDRIGWSRDLYPREFHFNSIDDIMENINHLPVDEEGYVCRIGDWRVKIKSPIHIAMSHLRSGVLTERKIIEIVYKCEEDEFLSYNRGKEELFTPWIETRKKMKNYFERIYKEYYDPNRALFGRRISVLPKPLTSVLFNMMDANGEFQPAYDRMRPSSVEHVFKICRGIFDGEGI